ncbi:MAG: hypothetical protein ACI9XP_000169 [Lentimonas sp.]|jgi:hypothetical protein
MADKMKQLFILILVTISFSGYSQIGIMGGLAVAKPFGAEQTPVGLQFGADVPQSDDFSYFGRVSLYPFGRESEATFPVFVEPKDGSGGGFNVAAYGKTNLYTLSGGIRYYGGEGYEFGFGVYGGTTFSVLFGKYSERLDEYDESTYRTQGSYNPNASLLGGMVGLNGGVKYGIPSIGTVFLDVNLDYILLYDYVNESILVKSNLLIKSGNQGILARVYFGLNIGIRRDILW